jgi:hypothetical protein
MRFSFVLFDSTWKTGRGHFGTFIERRTEELASLRPGSTVQPKPAADSLKE